MDIIQLAVLRVNLTGRPDAADRFDTTDKFVGFNDRRSLRLDHADRGRPLAGPRRCRRENGGDATVRRQGFGIPVSRGNGSNRTIAAARHSHPYVRLAANWWGYGIETSRKCPRSASDGRMLLNVPGRLDWYLAISKAYKAFLIEADRNFVLTSISIRQVSPFGRTMPERLPCRRRIPLLRKSEQ